jgi:CRP-like cAMP-binding protein
MQETNELAELVKLLCKSRLKDIPAASAVFRQGDPAADIFLVVEGRLRLVRYTEAGEALTLFTARQGQTFAEAALFSDHYHCTALADKASRVAAFAKKELLTSLASHPHLMLRLIALLSRQVRDLRTLLEIRAIKAAPDRILQYLKLKADPHGVFTVTNTLKDIAQELGLAHETLYRELAGLEKNTKIRRDGSTIRLLLNSD